jgi:hypothetical protein
MTPAPNVAEKNRAKGAARPRFFVARAAYRRRSRYSPVIRRCLSFLFLFFFPCLFSFFFFFPKYSFLKYFPQMFFKISFSLVPENILGNFYVLSTHARQPGFTQEYQIGITIGLPAIKRLVSRLPGTRLSNTIREKIYIPLPLFWPACVRVFSQNILGDIDDVTPSNKSMGQILVFFPGWSKL